MRWAALALVMGLLGCGQALPVGSFRSTAPAIDPIQFFTGHVVSWGVLENRSGEPKEIVQTDCVGKADDGTLRMTEGTITLTYFQCMKATASTDALVGQTM